MSPVEVDESLWNGWINEHDAREELEVQVQRVESLRNRHNPCQWDPIVAWERTLQAGRRLEDADHQPGNLNGIAIFDVDVTIL